jgi:hypothetical protein
MDPYPLDPYPYARRTPCYWWDEKPRRPDPPSPEDQKRFEEWLAWVKSTPRSDDQKPEPQ